MKKKYIKPEIENIVTKVEQHLLAGTPAGGHGGGNPGDVPDPPAARPYGYDKSITANPVGFTGSQWIDKEAPKEHHYYTVWE